MIMEKVKNIYTHEKGIVKELAWVGEHPIDLSKSIWVETKLMNGEYKLHEIDNTELSDKHSYSDSKADMMVKAYNWLTVIKYKVENYLDRNK